MMLILMVGMIVLVVLCSYGVVNLLMMVIIIVGVVNVILDLIFIFVLDM